MVPFFVALLVLGSVSVDWEFETSQTYISSIFEDEDGTMWCSTAGGILHYDPISGWDDPLVYPDELPWYRTNDLNLNDSLLWVATEGGGLALRRDDSWLVFTTYEGIPGTGVVYSVHCAGGYTWAGSDGGLSRGNIDGFTQIDESVTGGAFNANEVTGITSVSDILLLATDKGVYALDLSASPFNPESWTSYEEATIDLGISDVYAVSPDSIFGYGSGGVAFMISPDNWERLIDFSVSSDSVVTGLLCSDEGLIASCSNVRRYTGEVWEPLGDGYPSNTYSSCLGEACGRIWCGYGLIEENCHDTGKGLGYLENGTWTSVPVSGMASPSCYQMVLDSGRIYLGSHKVGLMAFYPDSGWQAFNSDNVEMPHLLRTYAAAKSSSPGIWTGSYHYGLTWIDDRGTYSLEDDTVITFVSDSISGIPSTVVQVVVPLFNNQVVMLAPQDEALWIAQEVFWLTPEEPSGIVAVAGDPEFGILEWTSRTEEDGLARKNIQMLFPCGQDSLWIAFTSDGGCQLLVHGGDPVDKSQDTWYPGPNEAFDTSWGLPSAQVFCFARETDGNILAGTGNGLCRWQGTGFVQIPGITGFVKTMQVDNKGRTWCTAGNSIFCLDSFETTEYTSSNSPYIPSSRVENEFSVFNQEDGKVYFSSTIGLWSLQIEGGEQESDIPFFYPQPFLPADHILRMCRFGNDQHVSVRIYSLNGEYLGFIQAESWEEWSWNGTFDDGEVSSGVYMAIVETGDLFFRTKVAVVR